MIAEQTSRSITLSWSPPTSPGDTKVNNYILQFKEARGKDKINFYFFYFFYCSRFFFLQMFGMNTIPKK